MRKTIYVPEGFDWDGLKVRAKDKGLSVSEFLLSGSRGLEVPQLDRIESKLDRLLNPGLGSSTFPVEKVSKETAERIKSAKPGEAIPVTDEDDPDGIAMLAAKQAELDGIKDRKIAKVKGNIRPDSEVLGDVLNQMGQKRRPMWKGK